MADLSRHWCSTRKLSCRASQPSCIYAEEAIGIARAAREASLPIVISFTLETDGRLPTGQTLAEAIDQVDSSTENGPACYMINCAHPTHFAHLFREAPEWASRIGALRANASKLSHEELDQMEEIDDGDPAEFGSQHTGLLQALPQLNVLGGCCGTDDRHVREICNACFGAE